MRVPDHRPADQKLADQASLDMALEMYRKRPGWRPSSPIEFLLLGILVLSLIAGVVGLVVH